MKYLLMLLLALTIPLKANDSRVIAEAEDFINTFYQNKTYDGSKYPKKIEVLFHDTESEEVVMFASYDLPIFDKNGYFLRLESIENFVLMRTDAGGNYSMYCLCDYTTALRSPEKHDFKNIEKIKQAIVNKKYKETSGNNGLQ